MFNKLAVAFGTGNADLSFAFRYPDLLLTGRTFINVIGFTLVQVIFALAEKAQKPAFVRQINLVFPAAFFVISGKHPDIAKYNNSKTGEV